MIDAEHAATLIRGILAVRNCTQKKLAQQAGVDYFRLSLYLNRHIDFVRSDLEKVLKALDLTDERVFTEKLLASISLE